MPTATIIDGTSDTNLGSLYSSLVSGGAQEFAGAGSGPKILEMTSSVIQTASFGNGLVGETNTLMTQDLQPMLAADAASLESQGTSVAQAKADVAVGTSLYNAATQAIDAAALAFIQNNASLLADIAQYCTANNITVEVEAVLTPPAANGVRIVNNGTITSAEEPYVNVWATAAAYAALPISAVEDIQEVGTEDFYQKAGLPGLQAAAAMEATGVSTLLSEYQAIAQNDVNAGAGIGSQPAGQVAVASQAAIAQAYSQVVSHLTVGDAEANDVAWTTSNVLQDVAGYWNAYDSIANAGTVTIYGWVEDTAGTVTIPLSQTYLPSQELNLPSNKTITSLWNNGTWVAGGAATVAIIDQNVTVFQAGTTGVWDYEINGSGQNAVQATSLYGIFDTTTINQGVTSQTLTFVADPVTATLASGVADFSFATADLGSGQNQYDWLSGLSVLASGGTIDVNGTSVSIGNNPTLALGEWNQAFLAVFTNRQAVALAEQKAIQIAGYGLAVSNIVNETWAALPVGAGLVSSPGSWTNADAEIASIYPLFQAGDVTATGTLGVSVTAPGQLVVNSGSTVALGALALNYTAADASTARLGIVIIDQTGTFSIAGHAGSSGSFGTSGTFSGAGSNVLVLNGTTADLAAELKAIDLTERNAGPDTIDIQTFGASGPLSDNQISVLVQASGVSDNAIAATSNLQGWISASAQLNSGTIASEVLNWNTTGILASNVGTATAGQLAFVETDLVHTTLHDYDVVQQSGGAFADSTGLVTNVDDNAKGGAPPTFDNVTALTVQSTTNTFDSAGNLAQSVDVLLAPENTNGTDSATLAQWGTQVTEYNTGYNQAWQAGWDGQFSSVTLTYNNAGTLVEEVLQGGASDPNFVIDNVYDPSTGLLWEQFQSSPPQVAPPAASPYTLATFITEFNQTDNPFWLPASVDPAATQSFTELALNAEVSVPTSAAFFDTSTVAYNTSLSSTSSVAVVTPNQFVNGTELDLLGIPNTISVNLNSLGTITVNSQSVATTLTGLTSIDADGATGNVTITGLAAGYSTLVGGNNVSTITGYGHDTIVAGNGTTTIGSGGYSTIILTGTLGAQATISSTTGNDTIVDSALTNINLTASNDGIIMGSAGLGLNLLGGTSDTILASGDTIQASSLSSFNVSGGGNVITLSTAGDTLGLLGGTGSALSASGDTIAAGGPNSFSLAGSNNGIILGSAGDSVTLLSSTGNTMLANGDSIAATGLNSFNVSGGNNSIVMSSAGDTLGLLGGVGNALVGSSDVIETAGANGFSVAGSNNQIVLGGSGNALTLLSGTGTLILASGDSITGHSGVTMTVYGSSDTVNLSTSSELILAYSGSIGFVTGGKDSAQVTVNTTSQSETGFNANNGDKIDLSQLLAGHGVTSGSLASYVSVTDTSSSTLLTINVNNTVDTVTLSGAGALSLQTLMNENAFVMPTH